MKDAHIPDLAFQKYICEKNGIKIKNCFIEYINKDYIKQGNIIPNELVLQEDVTGDVNQIDDIEENSERYIKIIEQGKPPEVSISKKCNRPYECPLKDGCRGNLPEYHVLQLTNWRKYWELFEDGILDIKDIPKDEMLSSNKDRVIKEAVVGDLIYSALKKRGLRRPLHSTRIYFNLSNDKEYDQIMFFPGHTK